MYKPVNSSNSGQAGAGYWSQVGSGNTVGSSTAPSVFVAPKISITPTDTPSKADAGHAAQFKLFARDACENVLSLIPPGVLFDLGAFEFHSNPNAYVRVNEDRTGFILQTRHDIEARNSDGVTVARGASRAEPVVTFNGRPVVPGTSKSAEVLDIIYPLVRRVPQSGEGVRHYFVSPVDFSQLPTHGVPIEHLAPKCRAAVGDLYVPNGRVVDLKGVFPDKFGNLILRKNANGLGFSVQSMADYRGRKLTGLYVEKGLAEGNASVKFNGKAVDDLSPEAATVAEMLTHLDAFLVKVQSNRSLLTYC